MSFLPCGLDSVNSHLPDWMPWVSFDPPPVKMSSVLLLTASVTKLDARAPLTGGGVTLVSAKTWSQSCEVVVEPEEPRTPVVTLASSSKVPRRLGVTRSSSCSSRRRQRRAACLPAVRAGRYRARSVGVPGLRPVRPLVLVWLMLSVACQEPICFIDGDISPRRADRTPGRCRAGEDPAYRA